MDWWGAVLAIVLGIGANLLTPHIVRLASHSSGRVRAWRTDRAAKRRRRVEWLATHQSFFVAAVVRGYAQAIVFTTGCFFSLTYGVLADYRDPGSSLDPDRWTRTTYLLMAVFSVYLVASVTSRTSRLVSDVRAEVDRLEIESSRSHPDPEPEPEPDLGQNVSVAA